MPTNPTELINRYLNAVKFWLPNAQHQDILAELAEDLHSQIEEREQALGHPVGEDDVVAILKRRGSPMRVASGYLPSQRLIDPALLPVYRLVLKVTILWVLIPLFLIIFVGPMFTSAHEGRVLLTFLDTAVRSAFMVVGIVTTVFALADRYHKFQDANDWDPRKLPRRAVPNPATARWSSFANFSGILGGAIFWAIVMWHRSEFVFEGGRRVILQPIWSQVYWIVLVLTLGDALIELVAFLDRGHKQLRACIRLGWDVASILCAGLLLRVGSWVELAGLDLTAAHIAKLMVWVNLSIQFTLIGVCAIKLIDALLQIRHLYRNKPDGQAPVLFTA